MDEGHEGLRLAARLAGFSLLPLISALSPFLLLPLIARHTNQAGWAAFGLGLAIGNMMAVAVSFGWPLLGPPAYAAATSGDARLRLYADSVVSRTVLSVAILPVEVAVIFSLVGSDWRSFSLMVALATGLSALSPAWYFVASGSPGGIARWDAVPRAGASLIAAVLITIGLPIWTYPVALITASASSVSLFSARLLSELPYQGRWMRRTWAVMRSQWSAMASNAAGSLYSSTPMPVANALSSGGALASLNSADRLFRLALNAVVVLANGLQGWVLECAGHARRRRQMCALAAHVSLGLSGFLIFALFGPEISSVLFGSRLAASRVACAALGLAFFSISSSTPLIRNVLIPSALTGRVLRATITGAIVGVPLMIGGYRILGASGVAVGFAFSETIVMLIVSWAALASFRVPRGHDRE